MDQLPQDAQGARGGVPDAVREFLMHIDKTLNIRRLYSHQTRNYQESLDKLYERCVAATASGPVNIRVGPTDLFWEKYSVVHVAEHADSFFFPLYRDGLRTLTIQPGITAEEIDKLLQTFEAEPNRLLSPSDDTVNFLWRCEFENVTFNAIDGIGHQEETEEMRGADQDDYGSLIADIVEKIRDPAPAAAEQTYAFVLDADVKVAERDFHYESTTTHRSFEENPALLTLTGEELDRLRSNVDTVGSEALLERFVEIIMFVLVSPVQQISTELLGSVFGRLLETSWETGDFAAIHDLLVKLARAAESAPTPKSRAVPRAILDEFLAPERIDATFRLVENGTMTPDIGERFWILGGDGAFTRLVEFWAVLPDGPLRADLAPRIQRRIPQSPEFIRPALRSRDPLVARGALSLLDETTDTQFAKELVDLAGSSDENLRIRGLAAAKRFLGPKASELFWKAMESDPSKPVRLFAFRSMAASEFPDLPRRLRALLGESSFGARPLWERTKYVRLLGRVEGSAAVDLFQSWLPRKRFLWTPKDNEMASLALQGLESAGAPGVALLRDLAKRGGKLGELARSTLDSRSRGGADDASLDGLRPPDRA